MNEYVTVIMSGQWDSYDVWAMGIGAVRYSCYGVCLICSIGRGNMSKIEMKSFQFLSGAIKSQKDLETLSEDLLGHSELLHHVPGPQHRGLVDLGSEVDDHRGQVLLLVAIEEQAVEHRQPNEISDRRVQLHPVVLQDQACELLEGGELQVEISCGQDEAFHFEELLHGVESVTEVDVLLGLEGVDLVVLGSHEESRDPQQLEIVLGDEGALEEKQIVNNLNTNLHGFILDLELLAHLHQPTQQHLPHLGADLRFPEVRVQGQLAGDATAERLVLLDQVFNNELKVGRDFRGTRGDVSAFGGSFSSNGFREVGEVCPEVPGGW